VDDPCGDAIATRTMSDMFVSLLREKSDNMRISRLNVHVSPEHRLHTEH